MAKNKSAADAGSPEHETPEAAADQSAQLPPAGDSAGEEPELPPAPVFSGDVLTCVEAAATTITGCTEAELKNFLATADYAARTLTLQLAKKWKKICRTASLQKDEGKSPIVKLASAIAINHENLMLMDTKMKTSFSSKDVQEDEIQADLRQVQFSISGAAADEDQTEPLPGVN